MCQNYMKETSIITIFWHSAKFCLTYMYMHQAPNAAIHCTTSEQYHSRDVCMIIKKKKIDKQYPLVAPIVPVHSFHCTNFEKKSVKPSMHYNKTNPQIRRKTSLIAIFCMPRSV